MKKNVANGYKKTNPKQTQFLQRPKMNVKLFTTKDYKNFIPLAGHKNKPNSNPIKPNFRKAQMNVNSLITKDYRKKDDFAVRKNKPNSNPISIKAKMNANAFSQKDYENETAFRPQKNKPNQSQCSLAQTMRFAILERRVVMEHLSRYWQTKWNCQINSLRKVVQKC